MLPYHFRAQEEKRGFFSLSMVLFGFEGDEIQIRLTPLPWNLMSGADSGNYLLCKLGCSLELETSTASPSYVAARLSLLLLSLTISPSAPKTTLLFSMLQMQNNPLSLLYPDWSSASCQTEGLFSLLWSLSTILIIIKRLHPSLHDLNQLLCSERDQPLLCPCFLITRTTKHKRKEKADKERCKAGAVKKIFSGINCD